MAEGRSEAARSLAQWESGRSDRRHPGDWSPAIPILLAKLQATDPGWKTNLSDLLNKQSLFSLEFTWAEEERAAALYGFGVLGTHAWSALPALEKMFWETSNTWATGAALGRIGEAALPILRAGLTNADRNIRFSAYSGTAVSSALAVATLPDMRQMTNDLDEAMAANAVIRLMRFAGKEETTRVAIEALASDRLLLRRTTLFKLTGTDIETNQIVPILIRLLEDPDGRFRQSVTNVLKILDPVAAAAAGINTNPPPMLGRDKRGRGPAGTNQPAAPRP